MITVRRTRGAALAAVAALALGIGAPSALAATSTTHHQSASAVAKAKKAKKAKQLAHKAALAKQAAAKSKTKAAARYLGVTSTQLSTALASGQSLADVAQDNGKTISGLVDALLASAKTFLAGAVTSGDITQAQSDAILAGLTRSIRADVSRSASPRPLGAGLGHGPFGGNLLDDAATYIGITQDALRTALQGGTSLATVATDNGKTVDGLIQALVDAAKADIAQHVTAGDLTQAQADQIEADLIQRITDMVNQTGRPDRGPGQGRGPGVDLAAAASYIGIAQDALQTALQGGDSLATVATDNGKTVDGLVQALVDAAKADIAQHVTAGDLTQAQADQIEADLTQRITDQVNQAGGDCSPGGPGGPGGGFGPGGFGGAPAGPATTTSSLGADTIAF